MLKNILVLVVIVVAGYYAYSSFYQVGDGIVPTAASDLPPLTSE
ncbi:hypothetical protein N9489_00675 [Methylophilaceae bacterium]|jgi:hypothetical protein|nr:hypothetical protein [Methylophilaceae bacterium]|tara:strand:+ start:734 stop:865 length:132 start_codon:yes stop_codon:yes gene_type:complete